MEPHKQCWEPLKSSSATWIKKREMWDQLQDRGPTVWQHGTNSIKLCTKNLPTTNSSSDTFQIEKALHVNRMTLTTAQSKSAQQNIKHSSLTTFYTICWWWSLLVCNLNKLSEALQINNDHFSILRLQRHISLKDQKSETKVIYFLPSITKESKAAPW